MAKLDLDSAEISVCLGALDGYRKSLVRAKTARSGVQGLPEAYDHQIKITDGAISKFRAIPLPGR